MRGKEDRPLLLKEDTRFILSILECVKNARRIW